MSSYTKRSKVLPWSQWSQKRFDSTRVLLILTVLQLQWVQSVKSYSRCGLVKTHLLSLPLRWECCQKQTALCPILSEIARKMAILRSRKLTIIAFSMIHTKISTKANLSLSTIKTQSAGLEISSKELQNREVIQIARTTKTTEVRARRTPKT